MKVMLTVGPMKTPNMECELEVPNWMSDAMIDRYVQDYLADMRETVLGGEWVHKEEP